MEAKESLFEVYDTWRAWSEREGEAIQSGDWPAVSRCQDAKRALQPDIIRLTDAVQQEWRQLGLDWAEVQHDLRAVIGLLMSLETRNSVNLALKRRATEAELAGLDGTRRQLQRVQHSYAPAQSAAWHSYS